MRGDTVFIFEQVRTRVVGQRGRAVSKAEFEEQARFVIRYLGATIEDGRQVDGIWYCRSRTRIIRLVLQSEVFVCFEYDGAAKSIKT
jgi:hypothetical protein